MHACEQGKHRPASTVQLACLLCAVYKVYTLAQLDTCSISSL